MKNLRVVFGIIRKYTGVKGIVNEDCFAALNKLPIASNIFFPLYSYLLVLYSLGLVKLSKFERAMRVTEKGMAITGIPFSASVLCVLMLHMLGRLLLLIILCALFWPVFLFTPKQHDRVEEEKSTG